MQKFLTASVKTVGLLSKYTVSFLRARISSCITSWFCVPSDCGRNVKT